MKQYPIFIEEPAHTGEAWGISVPNIAGCFSAADNEKDILANAREAILLSLADLDSIPEPMPLSKAVLLENEHCRLLLVDVDTDALVGPSKRINVSIREGLLNQIDIEAKKAGENRSEFLANSARQRITSAL